MAQTFTLTVGAKIFGDQDPPRIGVKIWPIADSTSQRKLKYIKDTAGNSIITGHAEAKATPQQLAARSLSIAGLPDPRDTTYGPSGFGLLVEVDAFYFRQTFMFGATEIAAHINAGVVQLEDVIESDIAAFAATVGYATANDVATGDAATLAAAKIYADGHTGTGAVASVNSKTGAVVLSASDVGADASGAATAAQSAAISAAASDATTKVANAVAAHLAATDPHGDRAYTNAQITAALNSLINSAPGTLDTLGEIAAQLATDESAVGALTTAVNARLATANNLSDVPDKAAARTNLGLGTAATQPATAFEAAGAVAAEATRATAAESANQYRALAPRLARPTAPETVLLTDFAAGHGWTQFGAATQNLNNTADVVSGAQSVSFTTDGAAGFVGFGKTGMPAMDLTGKVLEVLVKVTGTSRLNYLRVLMGSSGFANYYEQIIQGVPATAGEWIRDGVWQWVAVPWSATVGGGTPSRANITDVRLAFADTGGGTGITVQFDAIRIRKAIHPAFPSGVITLCFDDTIASQYTNAKPKMDQYGYPGVAYVIQDNVDLNGGALTLDQLHKLETYSGWEVAAHSKSATEHNAAGALTALTADQLAANFVALKSYLMDQGFRGADHFAYPQGLINDTVLGQTARFFRTGRMAAAPRANEVLPPVDALQVRAWTATTNTLAELTPIVDKAKAEGSWGVILFHDVTSGTVTNPSIQTSTAVFNALVDYIAAQGVPVRTMSDVMSAFDVDAPASTSTGTAQTSQIDTFTTSGTWTKPSWATTVEIICQAGGGGGGSGARQAVGAACSGGAGGGGGGLSYRTIPASLLTGTVTVTVGTGGAGGAAQTTDTTAGINGGAGNASSFGTYLRATGGGAGAGGKLAAASTAGAGGNAMLAGVAGGGGANGGVGGGSGGGAGGPGAQGGAGGGGISAAEATFGGGGGGTPSAEALTPGTAGTAPGGAGGAGADTTIGTTGQGASAGGGGSAVAAAGGAGGLGGKYGSGGGGGGSSRNTFASGAGGAGAPGIVQVISYP